MRGTNFHALRAFTGGALLTLLLGCSGPAPEQAPPPAPIVDYQIPWLEECKPQIVRALDARKVDEPGLEYAFVPFNKLFDPVPQVRGLIRLSSRLHDAGMLARFAAQAMKGCYPDTARKLALNDRRWREKLNQTRGLASRQGAKHVYTRLTDTHLHLYFPVAKP